MLLAAWWRQLCSSDACDILNYGPIALAVICIVITIEFFSTESSTVKWWTIQCRFEFKELSPLLSAGKWDPKFLLSHLQNCPGLAIFDYCLCNYWLLLGVTIAHCVDILCPTAPGRTGWDPTQPVRKGWANPARSTSLCWSRQLASIFLGLSHQKLAQRVII